MSFIKKNWKQGLTLLLSCGVAVGLNLHVITPAEATGAGTLLAIFGIHLPAISYGGAS